MTHLKIRYTCVLKGQGYPPHSWILPNYKGSQTNITEQISTIRSMCVPVP